MQTVNTHSLNPTAHSAAGPGRLGKTGRQTFTLKRALGCLPLWLLCWLLMPASAEAVDVNLKYKNNSGETLDIYWRARADSGAGWGGWTHVGSIGAGGGATFGKQPYSVGAQFQFAWSTSQYLMTMDNGGGETFTLAVLGETSPEFIIPQVVSISIPSSPAGSADAEENSDPAVGALNKGTYQITRTGSTASSLTVNYTTNSGQPINSPSFDYSLKLNGSWLDVLTIPSGSSSVNVELYAWTDGQTEPNETATLTISAASGGAYARGAVTSSGIIIIANTK